MTAKTLTVLALAGVTAAALSTAALAEKGMGGPDGALMLQKFDQIDADKDGKVTEAEIAAFRAARFAAADTDKNGSLSAEELSAMQMDEMQARMVDRATKMIGRLDTNGDGQLSADELAAMGQRKSPFQMADADGDGAISKEEAQSALQRMADRGGKHGKHGKNDDRKGWWWMDAN